MVRADTPAMPWARSAVRLPSISLARVSAVTGPPSFAGILPQRPAGGRHRGGVVDVLGGEAARVAEDGPEEAVLDGHLDAEAAGRVVVPLVQPGLAAEPQRAADTAAEALASAADVQATGRVDREVQVHGEVL